MIRRTIPIFAVSKYGENTDNSGSILTYHMSDQLQFNHDKEDVQFRLLSATYWWTFPNVNQFNNVLKFSVDAVQYEYQFEKALYSLSTINENISQFFVQNTLKKDLFVLIGDESTGKVAVKITLPNVIVKWSQSSISEILGFVTDSSSGATVGDTIIDANSPAKLNTVSSVLIDTNFTSGSYLNSKRTGIIASIPPSVSPGHQNVYHAINPIDCDVTSSTIDEMRFTLLDQNMRQLDTLQQPFTVTGQFVIYDK